MPSAMPSGKVPNLRSVAVEARVSLPAWIQP